MGFTDHCSTSILLAAYGNGSSEVESTPVMRGGAWSCAHLLEQPLCLHYSVQREEQVAQLPTDFQLLCRTGNLHSFLAVPIATDHEVLGALTIAKEDPEGFEVDWCVWCTQRVAQLQAQLKHALCISDVFAAAHACTHTLARVRARTQACTFQRVLDCASVRSCARVLPALQVSLS